jgi:hypothetical protein
MQQQLQYAQQYTSPENMAKARGEAITGVGQAYDAQAKNSADALRLQGLDPGAIASRLDSSVRTQRAASESAAGRSSDINRQLVGNQLLNSAINVGQTDQGLTQGMANQGTQQRNQAVNTGLSTTSTDAAARGTAPQWASLGATELAQWPAAEQAAGKLNNETTALWNDIGKQGSGAGGLIGAGLGALSSMTNSATGGVAGKGRPMSYADGGLVIAHDDPVKNWRAEREDMIRRAATPDNSRIDERLREQNELLSPPGRREGSTAYQGGGFVDTTPLYDKYALHMMPQAGAGSNPDTAAFGKGFKVGRGAAGGSGQQGQAGGTQMPGTVDMGNVYDAGPQGSGPNGTYVPGDTYDPSMFSIGGGNMSSPMLPSYNIGGTIGKIGGSILGSIYGGPIGGMAGGDIGSGLGGTVQDLITGNTGDIGNQWAQAGQGALSQLKGGLQMPGLGGGGAPSGPQGWLGQILGSGGNTGTGDIGGAGGAADMAGTDWGSTLGDAFSNMGDFARGGVQTGNIVPGSAQVPGIQGPDKVPAMLSKNEGIIPRDVMEWNGEQWLQKEIMKARKAMETQRVAQGEDKPTPPQAIATGPTFASEGATGETPQHEEGGRVRGDEEYQRYLMDYAVKKGEGEQFMDDVRRGPPYTSRGFAMGHNEGRIERAQPRFDGAPR